MVIRQQFPVLAAAVCVLGWLAATLPSSHSSDNINVAKPTLDRSPVSVSVAKHAGSSEIANAEASSDVATSSDRELQIESHAAPPSDEHAKNVASVSAAPHVTPASLLQPTDTADSQTLVTSGDEISGYAPILDECLFLEICVDHYLWELYQRTAKQDTSKVHELRKVKVKKKRKTVTVTKRITKLVHQDFTWKDPKAAEKAGMTMMDYVIGGMDPNFKLKLFQTLRAAEKADLAPGITSGFRDDYRQSIASGQKAASNKSYHGGSLRGGYGHGVAADVVSTRGATRAQRWVATESLWKWIDANEQRFGIGRPYLGKDPPHVAPIDGEEYISRRGTKTQVAKADEENPMRRDHAAEKTTKRQAARAAGAQR